MNKLTTIFKMGWKVCNIAKTITPRKTHIFPLKWVHEGVQGIYMLTVM